MATTCKLIAKQTLGSAVSTISFSSIPGTYTDLVLIGSLRSTHSGAVDLLISFNSTTTGYSRRTLYTTGTSALSFSDSLRTIGAIAGTNFTADTFSSTEAYIPNYSGSTNKSVSCTNAAENNGTSVWLEAQALLWSNTAAITAIDLSPSAGNFAVNTSVYLYGISKA